MESEIKIFKIFVENALKAFNLHLDIAEQLNCNEKTYNTYNKTVSLLTLIKDTQFKENLKITYLQQFQENITNILNNLQYRDKDTSGFIPHQSSAWKLKAKQQIEASLSSIDNLQTQLEFTLNFFQKIHFFSNNIVAIGANGSGKTSLSNIFKKYLQNNGLVISAQRILLVPSFNTISNPVSTASELKQSQGRDKTNKNAGEYNHLQQEFSLVLKNLLAENISAGNEYRQKSLKLIDSGKIPERPLQTKLDKTLFIWNSLIEHRVITCKDGMNIMAEYDDVSYSAIQMSDGEKVMLYLIGQVLQAPVNGFIVIDEPEMYLHKTILKKLWNILEKERQDCLFIYLTHDLDFATSRVTSKKIWIKSFTHPDKWDIEDIPENNIPESLLFELLGSRKNILFCEGEKGKIDEQIYSTIFPSFTIIPIKGCFDVINYTKAFNAMSNITTKAYGMIDSDYHDKARLKVLEAKNIYSFSVAEAENLFLNERFLTHLAKQLMKDESIIESIKVAIIKKFDELKEIQCSNYISSKINNYFQDSHISKGNKLEDVKSNFELFTDKIQIDTLYETRLEMIKQIIENKDYVKIISIFNNKGLQHIVNQHFKIGDFENTSLKLLQNYPETHKYLYPYFSKKIVSMEKSI